jgi:hypothetical protein
LAVDQANAKIAVDDDHYRQGHVEVFLCLLEGVAQGGFRLLAFADVAHDATIEALAAHAVGVDRQLDREARTVAAQSFEFDWSAEQVRFTGRHMAGQPAGMRCAVVGRNQQPQIFILQRACRLLEDGADRRVGGANHTAGVDGDDAVAQVFEDQPQFLLFARQFVLEGVQLLVALLLFCDQLPPGKFSCTALADVTKNDHRADGLSVGNDW